MSSYPTRDMLRRDAAKMITGMEEEKISLRDLVQVVTDVLVGEYEHGTADVKDIEGVTLLQYTGVARDILLVVTNIVETHSSSVEQVKPLTKAYRMETPGQVIQFNFASTVFLHLHDMYAYALGWFGETAVVYEVEGELFDVLKIDNMQIESQTLVGKYTDVSINVPVGSMIIRKATKIGVLEIITDTTREEFDSRVILTFKPEERKGKENYEG